MCCDFKRGKASYHEDNLAFKMINDFSKVGKWWAWDQCSR